MSGSLAGIGTGLAFGAANAALSALTGEGVMLLGPLVLTDFALPERVSHGGSQAMSVHKLLGGARIVDSNGPDDADISFGGIFLGITASVQSMVLDELRRQGKPVLLAWGFTAVRVVIQQASLEDSFMRCDYRITCTPVPDAPDDAADDGDGSTGDGEVPSTPDAAEQQGQGGLNRAAAVRATPARPAADPFGGAGLPNPSVGAGIRDR